jgi:hypothetical protein
MVAKRFSTPLTLICFSLLTFVATGCGYGIRGSHSDALEKDGVHRIYIAPITNNTYHYGVENVVYNSLVRSLAAFHGIKLVNDPQIADAVLAGQVTQADSSISASTAAQSLNPRNLPVPNSFGSLYVATEYTASLVCNFNLIRTHPNPNLKQAATVWTGGFSRSKPYPASNQLGVLGTTSGLINDSELDRTLIDISHDMMIDVRESIVSRF